MCLKVKLSLCRDQPAEAEATALIEEVASIITPLMPLSNFSKEEGATEEGINIGVTIVVSSEAAEATPGSTPTSTWGRRVSI